MYPFVNYNGYWIMQKARRFGYNQSYQNWLQELLNRSRRQYKLKRIKSRLRVSFIGYSYNTKTYGNR